MAWNAVRPAGLKVKAARFTATAVDTGLLNLFSPKVLGEFRLSATPGIRLSCPVIQYV